MGIPGKNENLIMKFIATLSLLFFFSIIGKSQTPSKTDEEPTAAQKRAALAEARERREAEAAREFKTVNDFADRFYESWKGSLDLVSLDESFITRNPELREKWLESGREFNLPDSLKLSPEQKFQLSLEEYSFLAVGYLLSERYEDSEPPELERNLAALEERHEDLLLGIGETDPGVYLQKMTRFFQEAREFARPFVEHPKGKTPTPKVDFPEGVSKEPTFEVERGPFALTIRKENGEYRISRLDVSR